MTSQQQGLRTHVFQTTELSAKRVVETINAAIKKKWEHTDIVRECTKQKLAPEEKAFILNFLVYWKELEWQPEYRESAKQMVNYLFKESAEHFHETGKISYCISLLGPDGSPAGMLLGALLRPYELLVNNKVSFGPFRGNDLINFYQYIVVPKEHRTRGAADVLRAQAEQFVRENTGHNSDIMIAQVDNDNPVYDDEAKVRMLRYEIPGLRHFEMIPEKGKVYAKQMAFPPASKQDPLTLRIDVPFETKVLSLLSVVDMAMAVVSYYDVYPGHVIVGTKTDAFKSYVRYHLKNVKADNAGNVKLEYQQ